MDAIASAVLSSKVNKLTKGFEDAVGLNEDEGHSEATADYIEAQEKARRSKEAAKRKKEREQRREQREEERDEIRQKYALPPRDTSKKQKTQPKNDDESKCILS